MNTKLRAALVWGVVCFLLLYRTLLTEIVLSWQVLQQYDVPIWQLVVTYSANIVPACIPLACFVWLTRKAHFTWGFALTLPFIAWLIGSCFVVTILWMITANITSAPPYSAGPAQMITQQIVKLYWTSRTLTAALIILVCSYAFWRECRLLKTAG
ncbi:MULTISPECIES: hypothetical protein [Pantoea]|uniref:Uncharacterized protein n=1 Tax=Candidatus Pantoea floridensis TaxID=1938870 RepID=A0A286DMD3_9GAMM|nr:hypothetical protein [Pantoea floridensis]PIF14679.1 hypothetical protein BX596_3778 [Enterobacteriaceae bacterium JKS000233]SOD59791.1 hypothetical protein SAMN06273570_4435 [Pantoea floridensis]HBZ15577.1 hypothetical protein [Pantoea sp.]